MKLHALSLFLCLATFGAYADEWGDWDDLPDNLISPAASTSSAIDQLYSRLSSNDFSTDAERLAALSAWLDELDLDFSSNEELQDLLEDLEGESDAEIAEELQEWLEEQAEESQKDLDDLLDELEDEREDRLDEEEDELDDLLDEEEDRLDEEELSS